MRNRKGIILSTVVSTIAAVTFAVGGSSAEAKSTTPWWAPQGYHPCASDGSGTKCYWWAAKRGNRKGSSYYVQPNGFYVYVTTTPCVKTSSEGN